jgi:hypothetical protein
VSPEEARDAEFRRLLGEAAKAQGDEAIELYKKALALKKDPDVEKAVARLEWLKRIEAAKEPEAKAKRLLASNDPAGALEELDRMAGLVPRSRFLDLEARALHADAVKKAKAALAYGNKDREAAAAYRKAWDALGQADPETRTELEGETSSALERIVRSLKKNLTPDQKRTYLEEILAEARQREEARDYRGALRLMLDAQTLDDEEFQAAAKRVRDMEPKAEDEAEYRAVERFHRRVADDPESSEERVREVAKRYQAYLEKHPEGLFAADAKAALARVRGGG